MELLDGKAVTGLKSITVGDRRVLRTWSLVCKDTENVMLELNLSFASNVRLIIRHEKNPAINNTAILRSDTPDGQSPYLVLITLVNYDKAGKTTWTNAPIRLFKSYTLEGPMVPETEILLDFVMHRLTSEDDAQELCWQYFITISESTSYPDKSGEK